VDDRVGAAGRNARGILAKSVTKPSGTIISVVLPAGWYFSGFSSTALLPSMKSVVGTGFIARQPVRRIAVMRSSDVRVFECLIRVEFIILL
jgi:hypothetical protein